MKSCTRCGSYAINLHSHGRKKDQNTHLCDVCYWRTQAEAAFSIVNNMADIQFENSKLHEELNENGLVLQKLQDERDKALSRVDRLEEFLGVSEQAKTECIFGKETK